MPVPITCPGCGVKMSAPDAAVGKNATCPKCQTPFVVAAPPPADPGYEVVEDEVLDATEILEDEPPPPAVAANAAPAGNRSTSQVLAKKLRNKKQVDATDYLTKVNGKPIAVRPGEVPPPPMPRKSAPRD